jgi:hypothetical protein
MRAYPHRVVRTGPTFLRFVGLLPAALMTITGLACSSDSDNSSGARMDGGPTGDGSGGDLGPSPRAAAIYDQSRVVEFEVAFPAGEWERLLTLMGEAHTRWVTCSLRFEGEAFPNAACRRKGNTAEWAAEKKPQFVVRFNLADKNGRFRGLRRLNFEAYDGLPAPIRDRLAMSLMRQSGVDAPRVNHARVIKDGKLLGLYMNIEVVDREFLEDHFGHADADGNLWEDGLELSTNELVNDRTRLEALDALVEAEPETGDHAAFYANLDTLMDIDQVLREMAAETAVTATDNFSNGAPRNFYYYEHPRRGFLVLPWDLDLTFTEAPADADPFSYSGAQMPSKLRRLMNQNPAWRERYLAALIDIRDNVLAGMPAQVDQVCAQIQDSVRQDTNRASDHAELIADCEEIKRAIVARVQALKIVLGR